MSDPKVVEITGETLTVSDLVAVAHGQAKVMISTDPSIRERIQASRDFILDAVENGVPVYGVTTHFGANAGTTVPQEEVDAMQNNTLWMLKTGAGSRIPKEDVRAGMLARLNSLVRGVSGIRIEFLERIALFLNEDACPIMYEFGSIGASGDLVPLTYLAGCLTGVNPEYQIEYKGSVLPVLEVLTQLGLEPMPLQAKEALALINGTSVLTGIATRNVQAARSLFKVSLLAHAMVIQALGGTEMPFDPFVEAHKRHPGHKTVAGFMRAALAESKLTLEGQQTHFGAGNAKLPQDCYSLRCIPQYMGPTAELLDRIERDIELELNSANDNPLIDVEGKRAVNGGNFMGQYMALDMDQLRHHIGLMAQHLDQQIALLMTNHFSNGLPNSLIGNPEKPKNMGFKALQLTGNSIMPVLGFLGNSLADRFPAHAEQFNQNINSLGYSSANLGRQSVDTFRHYLSVVLMMVTQAVDLKTNMVAGHYDARKALSPQTADLYTSIRSVTGRPISPTTPYVFDDSDIQRDQHLALLTQALRPDGLLVSV